MAELYNDDARVKGEYVLGVDTIGELDAGIQNENDASIFIFDTSQWKEDYGSGNLNLRIFRRGDEDPYPVQMENEGTENAWIVSNVDTEIVGKHRAQLTYVVDGVRKKTTIFFFRIAKSIVSGETAPDPYDDWLETLQDMADNLLEDGEALLDEVEGLKDEAAGSATSADASARAASLSAESADTSKGLAQRFSMEALAYSDEAKGYRNETKGYHDSVEDIADVVTRYKDETYSYRNDAQAARQTAMAQAQMAADYRTQAYNSATSASNSATSAANSATSAASSAESAHAALQHSGIIDMSINSVGHLIYTKTEVVAIGFDLDNRGHLIATEVN